MVSLEDPLWLGGGGIMVPEVMAQLLALSDGTRDLDQLREGFSLRTGVDLLPSQVESLVQALDEAYMLDSPRFHQALDQVMVNYRQRPFRTPALAGNGYPADPKDLQAAMDHYSEPPEGRAAGSVPGSSAGSFNGAVVGLISPHIDYHRGSRTYAETWLRVRSEVEAAQRIIILGTDHAGSPGSLTLTRQSYATPWGTLPTDSAVVDQLASILGEDQAFAQEAHHIGEHSIELAAVWLHYIAGGKPKTLIPILCGGPGPLLEGRDGSASAAWEAVDLLAGLAASEDTLVVAAADISHVGPTFGDETPLDDAAKEQIRSSDQSWLEAACAGGSGRLRDYITQNGDPTRICGATPIYLMSYILGEARGRVVSYDQCPADEGFGSLVSVAGVLYNR